MTTPVREWPNVYGNLRDDIAEMAKLIIAENEQIAFNKINDEEGMEKIAADTIRRCNLILRSLERAGAETDPLAELAQEVGPFRVKIPEKELASI